MSGTDRQGSAALQMAGTVGASIVLLGACVAAFVGSVIWGLQCGERPSEDCVHVTWGYAQLGVSVAGILPAARFLRAWVTCRRRSALAALIATVATYAGWFAIVDYLI